VLRHLSRAPDSSYHTSVFVVQNPGGRGSRRARKGSVPGSRCRSLRQAGGFPSVTFLAALSPEIQYEPSRAQQEPRPERQLARKTSFYGFAMQGARMIPRIGL